MKKDIHPTSTKQEIKCSTCDYVHNIILTVKDISIDICSNCHGFYTGNTGAVKATGRVERFNKILSGQKKTKK
ncbi:50S ribosomal protein L31 [Candidatus Mycoplasma mahonii]|uniref:50S ribosomal protein L31 n=1 Tax=Candidatus Mycoplasma mahonii TaxID=3004105 RepID=UPI0026EA9ED8|nr:50S ribosomal protein L31 [Candidatus Mycoplasma mahonii]WKX02489.1 50S ribosomal protein L31 [Candidatus Mycoplasma mahonii]